MLQQVVHVAAIWITIFERFWGIVIDQSTFDFHFSVKYVCTLCTFDIIKCYFYDPPISAAGW